jgi:transcription elongation factor GreA
MNEGGLRRVPTAAELLKSVGLLADGPVKWGSPVRSARPGIAIVELPAPLAQAPVDVSICGKWAERVPTLLLDGERPDGKLLARRLAAFWLPSATILYVVSTEKSLGARVGALYATELGSRRPHSGGNWLKTLRGLEGTRVWWAETDAVVEYEDAILGAFADLVPAAEAAALHDPSVVLPFANLATTLGEKKRHGLTGTLLAAEEPAPSSIARSVRPAAVPAATRRSPRAGAPVPAPAPRKARAVTPKPEPPRPEPTYMSPSGLERLQAELAELRDVQRPAVVARIKAARELGDLRENADYEAARREQSFIEGRVQAIEAILRNAHVVDDETVHEVIIGSTVVLERHGESIEYRIVGSSEASPAEGRISYMSPIGKALLGRRAGDDVVVKAPSGDRHYRVAEVR